jgi:hypothetical protein
MAISPGVEAERIVYFKTPIYCSRCDEEIREGSHIRIKEKRIFCGDGCSIIDSEELPHDDLENFNIAGFAVLRYGEDPSRVAV